jgi:D-alanyl-D-alanine carboxypeptidase/D-alanyl-D-alanine-endopeptidase (penicillin-binding protein 4)
VTDEQPPSRRAAREAGAKAAKPPRQPRAPRTPRTPKTPATPAEAAPVLLDENGQPIAPKGGIMAMVRKHPTRWLIGTLGVAFLMLGTGAIFAGVAYGSTSAAPDPGETQVAARPQPAMQPATAALRTCSVLPYMQDERLMSGLYASVRLADSGDILFQNSGATPQRTASTLKVLTAAAAVMQLGADFQVTTSVVAGSQPGTIVLVGRGDATLSAMPPGTESVYAGAPKLSTLAAATIAQFKASNPGQKISTLVLDASYWNSNDKWDPSWERSEQTTGYHSEVTALQVDGDREDPTKATSPRSTDPIGHAGAAFVEALKDADTGGVVADNVTITNGTASSGNVLAEVRSQPLRVLIPQMLLNSDNTLAEMLARIVSKDSGLGGSAASLQQAIPSLLWPEDPATARSVTIKDGSGLSENNAVPADVMSEFMRRVASGGENLDVVRDALPVAGKTGSLASRFTGDNAVAAGHVVAKTGWIKTSYSLAGFMDAADGTRLTFAFYAVGDGIQPDAKDALDTLTTAVYNCGNNLASF